ncbi:hypothetical protein Aab01nite_42220 [Paractinoplanes abujensis]|jgi:hypothetical protein|uniref:DUF2630 family protein n=2 Tax=Paractinoplanes TaxID=3240234 RepID=A0A7W7CT27_9ACTN|nr:MULTISPECIES: DUF2630 family protein [Actinoplanes]MBB4694154.1 hypothetical protein [Actinoplanes abujensis]TDO37551.1 uncharacterized protein DUF2630 [Actinoplanes brasiliensis]GID20632.1 hypothetical protein Aab01nite_42220 [Actinoplanes abujensis]GID31881.1 hypothetical protein Abr02nite_68640 [Actinoplanes brasiliensis]
MDDKTVLSRIHGLVDEEHKLRTQLGKGEISSDEEHARLKELEEALDQCWDLLRRRRAAREVGNDPNAEQAHSVSEVEGYLQ